MSETTGEQQPPERPGGTTDDDPEIASKTDRGLSGICTEPGDRKTDSVWMLVIEAELASEGTQLDNPAKPRTESVGESFRERIDDTDLVPAWTRPWEGGE